jgi:transcriptional regulator with XRE-family HTH domain
MEFPALVLDRVPGERLRARREALRLTRRTLSRLSGVPEETIGKFERGQARIAKWNLRRLEAVLDTEEVALRDGRRGLRLELVPVTITEEEAASIGRQVYGILAPLMAGYCRIEDRSPPASEEVSASNI